MAKRSSKQTGRAGAEPAPAPLLQYRANPARIGDPGRVCRPAAVAGVLFVVTFMLCQNRWKIDDVLGVWPLHGLCGLWGGIACGIFGLTAPGGLGGVSFLSQLAGSLAGAGYALAAGAIAYGVVKLTIGIRLTEEEDRGADLAIHKICAYSEEEFIKR